MIQLPELRPDSEVPLYRQLYESIRQSIEMGSFRRGDRVPPTRELAQTLGVNRATVAAAYDLLEADGLIRGHVGRGSYVQAPEPRRSSASTATISFATSRPSEDLFPLDEFRQTAAEVLADPQLAALLQLGAPAGLAPLRRYLLEKANAPNEEVLITSGCQQALDLTQRVFAPPASTVIVEDPTYGGLKSVFERQGVRLVGLPVGSHGIDPVDLERSLERERPRLVLLTPNFQNPTGATLPIDARRRIGELITRAGVPLIEIDIYRDLRYAGAALPSIKSLAPDADVLLLGSFSKIAFPGLRTGWMIGPRSLITRLTEAKQWSDLHSDQLSQAILLRFAESGRLERHLKKMLAANQRCLEAAIETSERELPEGSVITRPQGGMNLWITLPEPLDAAELLPLAQREGVAYLPGRHFAVDRRADRSLRLSFAGVSPEQIRAGITILGRVARSELARRSFEREAAPAMV